MNFAASRPDKTTTLIQDQEIASHELNAYDEDKRHSKYWRSLQTLKPIRFPKRKVPAPVDNAGLLSYITFSWFTNVIFSKNVLEIEDLPPLSLYDSARHASNRLIRLYEEDDVKHNGRHSIGRAVFRFIWTRMLVSGIVCWLATAAQFIGPAFLIRRLIAFSLLPSPGLGYGLALVAGLFLTELVRAVANSVFFGMNYRTAMRVRGALITLLFRKITRLRSLKNKSVGELVNLLSNDGRRLVDMVLWVGVVVSAPLQAIATIVYVSCLLGWTSIIGIVVLFSYIPLQVFIAKQLAKFREEAVAFTDTRVKMMNEILTCVRLIKMYAWENSFAAAVGRMREKERNVLARTGFVQSLQGIVAFVLPVLSCAVMFLVHTLIGYPLTAPDAFTVLALFIVMRGNISVLPLAAKSLAETFVSFRRMDSLLSMEEIEQYYVATSNEDIAVEFNRVTAAWDVIGVSEADEEDKRAEAVLRDISLSVPKGRLIGICGPVGSGKSALISTILGHLRIQQGSLGLSGTVAYVPQQAWIFHDTARENILFGSPYHKEKYDKAVGACALVADFNVLPDNDLTEIGERGINLSGGQKQRVSLARAVYSERDIILLDDPLSAVDAHVGKHIFFECIKKALVGKTVIFVTHQLQYLKDCDEVLLLQDGRITEFGAHDELMIKQKDYALMINNYNIDKEKKEREKQPSEELDSEMVKKIIERRKKTGNSSMEKYNFLIDDVNSNSREHSSENAAESNGCPRLSAKSSDVASVGQCKVTFSQRKQSADDDDEDVQVLLAKKPTVLVKKETRQTESVQMSTYLSYARCAGGLVVMVMVLSTIVLTVVSITAVNWWLSYWIDAKGKVLPCSNGTSDMSTMLSYASTSTTPSSSSTVLGNLTCEIERDLNISTNPDLVFYQVIYFAILIVTLLLVCVKSYLYSHVTLKASSGLQSEVFRSVFASPMSFFDTTPTGRILNRFSSDLDEVDTALPYMLEFSLIQIMNIAVIFITIIFVFPWFTIVFVVFMMVFLFVYISFRKSVIQLKTLLSTSRSPWFSHVTSTIQGLNTIHAYAKTDQFVKTFGTLLDRSTCPDFAFLCSGRWIGVRLNIFSSIVTTFTALFAVLSSTYPHVLGSTTASFAGLALAYSITLSGVFHLAVRYSIDTGSYFTSVERINDYIVNCPPETPLDKKIKPVPKGWPAHGEIQFSDVSMRYRPGLPVVLKSVNFSIKPKEKIGIVGRTGSGKTSLGTVLFHLVNLESGTIQIDGCDIDEMSLETLRGNLSIIPQDPVLFAGTVRYNLDPFQQYSDAQVWQALERSHIKSKISDLPDKLDSEVVENGENFSVGERQLLCMARAILRHSRIIMLDEATAAIDSETDHLVQDTIREAFADCTMLTIAHRLNTVLTCDRILVMDNGEVAEFDDPAALLSNPHSKFTRMVKAVNFENTVDKERAGS